MKEVHLSPAELMLARNGTTTVVSTANRDSGIEVAFDVEGGEMAPLDEGVARVVLSTEQFQQIADNTGRYEVKADDGSIYDVSVWA